jgi:hypothetical protein
MKRDPKKYKWYIYSGKRPIHVQTDNKDFDFSLENGEKFGVKLNRGTYFLVDASDLTMQFKLKPQDAEKILKGSKGWEGTIDGQKVQAGGEGTHTPAKPDADGYVELESTSSVLKQIFYNKKEKILRVVFPSGDVWLYHGVTPAEAKHIETDESQGRYFNRVIKPTKEAEIVGGAAFTKTRTKTSKKESGPKPAPVAPVQTSTRHGSDVSEIDMSGNIPTTPIRRPADAEVMVAARKGERVIVNMGDGTYMLATVTSVRAGKVHIRFDDGDKGTLDDPKNDIAGLAKNNMTSITPFTKKDFNKYWRMR